MFCPTCGTQNQDTDKYCKKCGSLLPSEQSQQPMMSVKTQLPGVACHYPGCTQPVIGQCSGYKDSCLRYYCAKHSVEAYCSVCVNKLSHDAAVEAVYRDYLNEAKKVDKASLGLGGQWFFLLGLPIMSGGIFYEQAGIIAPIIGLALAIGLVWMFRWATRQMVSKVAINRPGFAEFYAEYRRDSNAKVVLGALLVAGAASRTVQEYQMRQDIHQIAKRVK